MLPSIAPLFDDRLSIDDGGVVCAEFEFHGISVGCGLGCCQGFNDVVETESIAGRIPVAISPVAVSPVEADSKPGSWPGFGNEP